MPKSSIDRYFERFVRRGDMRALGQVFDATAPALYRIALHLRPCAAAAEDLVQSTFVTAIRKRSRFEPGRRVFPWLLGILTLHARDLHRRERSVSLQTEEVEESTPLDEIDRRETRECIEAAISGLPQLYREVVRRYLQDGTSPREISRQLCRVASLTEAWPSPVRSARTGALRPAPWSRTAPALGRQGSHSLRARR